MGGLITRHWLQGEYLLYPWGQQYFGSSIVLVTSIAMRLLGTGSIFAFRFAPAFFTIVLAILTTNFAWRMWGKNVAAYAAWILAFPGAFLLLMLVMHPFSHYAVLATICLMIVFFPAENKKIARIVVFSVLGVLTGIGLWASPTFMEYMVALFTVVVLRSQEWETCWQWIRRKWASRTVTFAVIALLCMFVVALVCSVLTEIRPLFSFVARTGLAAMVLLIAGVLFLCSSRKKYLCGTWVAVIGGFIVGNIPMWWTMFFTNEIVDFRVIYFIPTWKDLSTMMHTILPAFWGIPPLIQMDVWGYTHSAEIASAGVALIIGCCLVLWWLWSERGTWKSIFCGQRLTLQQSGAVMIFLLFFIPMVSLTMRRPMHHGDVRYVLEAWPAWALMAGVILHRIALRSRTIAITALMLFLIPSAHVGYTWIQSSFRTIDGPYAPQRIEALRAYVEEWNVTGGYAQYALAYPFNFLLNEQYIFTMFERPDIYPPFVAKVNAMDRYALVIHLHRTLKQLNEQVIAELTPEGLLAFLELKNVNITDEVRNRIMRSKVLDMRKMQQWDVWILEDASLSQ